MANLRKITVTPTDLAGLAQGDERSFTAIYNEFSGLVFHVAAKILKDRDAAADVLQDVFTGVWNKREYWAGADSFCGLLIADTRNKCLNRIDKKASENKYRFWFMSRDMSRLKTDSLANLNLLQEDFAAAMAKLSPHQRLIYDMCREGWEYTELAQLLSVSKNDIKYHMKGAYRCLRQELKAHLDCA